MGRPLLENINQHFHEIYDEVRRQATLDGPVCVLLADSLLFFRAGERSEVSFSPPAFHDIKAVSHLPIAIYAAWQETNATARSTKLAALAAMLRRLDALPADPDLSPDVVAELRAVVDDSLAFLQRSTLDPEAARGELEVFARHMGPKLLRLTEHATRLQLRSLDAHVTHLFAGLTPSERANLQVVVTGNHQARARSLAAQYFRKRLREPENFEERVTYAEGVDDEQEALALVGTRRIDRAMASAFFGDPRRLQRDILGDAAKQLLTSCDWESGDGTGQGR